MTLDSKPNEITTIQRDTLTHATSTWNCLRNQNDIGSHHIDQVTPTSAI